MTTAHAHHMEDSGLRITPFLLVVGMLFVGFLITANILAVKIARIGMFTVPAAIVVFPLTYLFDDVLTEVWGYAASRIVIWTGFLTNALVVVFIECAIALPGVVPGQEAAFRSILGATPRVVAASFVAYLAGEFLNSYVLARLKVATDGKFLWFRTIGSTVVGQSVDTALFISFAFLGILPFHVLLATVGSVAVLKIGYEVVATPLTYAIVTALKRHEHSDVYDRNTVFSPIPIRQVVSSLKGTPA